MMARPEATEYPAVQSTDYPILISKPIPDSESATPAEEDEDED